MFNESSPLRSPEFYMAIFALIPFAFIFSLYCLKRLKFTAGATCALSLAFLVEAGWLCTAYPNIIEDMYFPADVETMNRSAAPIPMEILDSLPALYKLGAHDRMGDIIWNTGSRYSYPAGRRYDNEYVIMKAITYLSIGLFSMLSVLFCLTLWRKWLDGHGKGEEHKIGMAAVRGWLKGWQICWVGMIVLLGWLLFGGIGWMFVLVAFAIWLAFPDLVKRAEGHRETPAPTEEKQKEQEAVKGVPAEQTEQVLRMIEEKKISPEEGAELLGALPGANASAQEEYVPLSVGRKLVLAGAVCVLISIFLTWFTMDISKMMGNLSQSLTTAMAQNFPGLPSTPNSMKFTVDGIQQPFQEGMQVEVAGTDMENGLGWVLLVAILIVAAMPYLNLKIDSSTQRLIVWASLAIGTVILLYLLSIILRLPGRGAISLGLGFYLAVVGYTLAIAGTVRELRDR